MVSACKKQMSDDLIWPAGAATPCWMTAWIWATWRTGHRVGQTWCVWSVAASPSPPSTSAPARAPPPHASARTTGSVCHKKLRSEGNKQDKMLNSSFFSLFRRLAVTRWGVSAIQTTLGRTVACLTPSPFPRRQRAQRNTEVATLST